MRIDSISFVLPMFNEAENISNTVNKVSNFAAGVCDDYEVIIVDDASSDGSGDIVSALASKDGRIKLIRLKENTKFGGALNEGLKNASKGLVVYTDSDFPAKEDDMKKALEMVADTDIVTAYSLVIKDSSIKRIVMSKVYNFLVHLLFGLKIRDINSGLKIYKKEALKGLELKSRSPFIDVEIFAEAAKRGFRIRQYGLIFELRTKGESTISRAGIVARTFYDMLRYKLSR